ncbi:universal stress protein [Zunongwangia sp. F363]|uniref:Universal stress protein n=1 Tax=Autumnicola tepida TaxID=3075595 RepID=A0ABU3C8Y4_9FLAO|nr:universal stress protein [Zunongwangia sp. F363]MDT0642800.1 universal stress protein [Zunongwangia sp. F363]
MKLFEPDVMNVLILTDFSEVSNNTGKYALDFLGNAPGQIYVLNIQNINFKKAVPDVLERKMVEISGKLHKSIELFQQYSNNLKLEFHSILSSENLINAVRRCVAEKKIDLIFIGAISRDVRHHPLLGDHAYEVVRKIKCNIVAVPENQKYRKPETSILPIDYSVLSEERIYQHIKNCSFLKDTQMTVVEIEENDFGVKKEETVAHKLPDLLNGAKVDYIDMAEPAIFSRDVLLEIQEKFDIIVVLGKNLNVCDRLLHTRYGLCSMVNNQLPILVLHG